MDQISTLLRKQNWETAKCKNKLVNSYIEFYIVNTDYRVAGDNKSKIAYQRLVETKTS